MKFPSHLNCDGKIVSEMGPRARCVNLCFRLLNYKLLHFLIISIDIVMRIARVKDILMIKTYIHNCHCRHLGIIFVMPYDFHIWHCINRSNMNLFQSLCKNVKWYKNITDNFTLKSRKIVGCAKKIVHWKYIVLSTHYIAILSNILKTGTQ